MLLVNETNQTVSYTISSSSSSDCGQIDSHGVKDVSGYDNQTNVTIHFSPVSGPSFMQEVGTTKTDQILKLLIAVE
jgi:hypothetical protein